MQIITDENTKIENNLVLPVLAVRGLVFFPGMMLQFDVARKKSILAVSEALSKDRLIFLVTQIDLWRRSPGARTCTRQASSPGLPRWCTTPRRV